MDLSYLARPAGECHGDEHLLDEVIHDKTCIGDPDIWCSCLEKQEQAREHMCELSFLQHEHWD